MAVCWVFNAVACGIAEKTVGVIVAGVVVIAFSVACEVADAVSSVVIAVVAVAGEVIKAVII